MNSPQPDPSPAPAAPTPQTVPTVVGVLQGLLTSYGAFYLMRSAGIPPEASAALSGSIVSAITSGVHKIAQRMHWSK